MELPKFTFDFSFLDLDQLQGQCISTGEIVDVFYNLKTVYYDWHDTEGLGYMIGYSLKNKFLSLTFKFRNDKETVRATDVYLSYESEIRNNYFGIG